jgi:hypothetical protein
MLSPTTRIAVSLGLALIFTFAVLAQTAAPNGDSAAPPVPQVQSAGGIEYLNGGAGEESRAGIDAQGGAFPLRIVFSVASGAYAVADHVEIADAKGKLLGVDDAGPMLLVKVAPGDYAVEATYAGKTERRRVRVGGHGTTVNWRWPEETKR